MEELSELFEKLDGVEPSDFAKAFKESAPKHYQYIWNGGHKTAYSDQQKVIDKLQKTVDDFDAERAKLEARVETLGKDQPDLKALQERHEAALIAKDEQHKTEIEKIKGERETWQSKYAASNVDSVVSGVVSELVSEGVDRDYAVVQVSKPGFRDRIRRNDEGEVTGALQKDGQTPFPLSDGQTVSAALAREILSDVPDKWRADRRQQGAGIGDKTRGVTRYTEETLNSLKDDEFQAAVKEIDEGRAVLEAS